MSFWEILNNIILKPIQLFYEIILMILYEMSGNVVISIIILTLLINFVLLDLCIRRRWLYTRERKDDFSGLAHYKVSYVLKELSFLCISILFFAAVYGFFADLQLIKGVPFGEIPDLSKADGIIRFENHKINVLPLIMLFVNAISWLIYTRGRGVREKYYLCITALAFFAFLYNSPSALLLYWIVSHLFFLVKIILDRMKKPREIFIYLSSCVGLILIWCNVFVSHFDVFKLNKIYGIVGTVLQLPLLHFYLKKSIPTRKIFLPKAEIKQFVICGIFMTTLTGVLIPTAVLSTSPQEFVDIMHFYHPIWFVCSALCLSTGLFLFLPLVIFGISSEKMKSRLQYGMLFLSVISFINFLYFGNNLGLLNSMFQYKDGFTIHSLEKVINLIVLFIAILVLNYLLRKREKMVFKIVSFSCIVIIGLSAAGLMKIHMFIEDIDKDILTEDRELFQLQLSKTEKNVVFLMLDRAYGGYIPYFIQEKPEFKEKFDGFTYYSNVISFGGHTNFAAPALYGGYEYTPLEMNKRNQELLVLKHNEALKVMPTIFSQNGFEVTIADAPYVNYQWVSNPAFFEQISNTKAYNTDGVFLEKDTRERVVTDRKRDIFCYSLMKCIPCIFQEILYADGTYRKSNILDPKLSHQIRNGLYSSEGVDYNFMSAYSVLINLSDVTNILEDGKGQFISLANNTTHEPVLLQEPDYIPSLKVDNLKYSDCNPNRYTVNQRTMHMDYETQLIHYQTNMAALLEIGKWLDYLRKNDVYDNTRIIIASDHGYSLAHFDELIYEDSYDLSNYYPLLMVKDFADSGFKISNEFMTNADVLNLATQNIIDHPTNPFTGKSINSDAKKKKQYIIASHEWEIQKNNGCQYLPSDWFSISNDIWDRNNWELLDKNDLLDKYKNYK